MKGFHHPSRGWISERFSGNKLLLLGVFLLFYLLLLLKPAVLLPPPASDDDGWVRQEVAPVDTAIGTL